MMDTTLNTLPDAHTLALPRLGRLGTACLIAAFTFGADQSANAALVGHWSGDGTAFDSVSGNHGTINGDTSFVAGAIGQAFKFDGAGDFIAVPGLNKYQFGTGDFTVSFWVKFDTISSNGNGIVSKDSFSGTATYNGWLFNNCTPCGGTGLEVRNVNSGGSEDINVRTPSADFNTSEWYQIAGVRSGTQQLLYVNGNLVATSTSLAPVDVSNNGELRIGSLSAFSPQFFSGAVDDVRLYDTALSEAEVRAMSAVPLPSSYIMLASAVAALGVRRRRKIGALQP